MAQQQSGKGFLLVYDLASKQPGLLDLIKVRQLVVGPLCWGRFALQRGSWPGVGSWLRPALYLCVAQRVDQQAFGRP